ncbi:MAG: pentapeptide repeat-containing protein [Lentisphaeraceae bacterium]|nr:pentapeptide repeat-containing protein [Lentisphaeraceae bacterium]
MSAPKKNYDEKPSKNGKIKPFFSAEAIAASGGVVGVVTLLLLVYQNMHMANQTDQMLMANTEMATLREMMQRERFNRLLELLYEEKQEANQAGRLIRQAKYNTKIRTEAFHETVVYLKYVDRELDFSGELQGYGIDFRGEDFSKIDLSRANLKSANLSNGNFDEAKLSGVDFYHANLSQSSFKNSDLSKSFFYRTNLQGSQFSGAIFKETVFRDLDFSSVNISGADLSGASFYKVDLTGVDLRGVKYDKSTVWPEGFDVSAHKDKLILIDDK